MYPRIAWSPSISGCFRLLLFWEPLHSIREGVLACYDACEKRRIVPCSISSRLKGEPIIVEQQRTAKSANLNGMSACRLQPLRIAWNNIGLRKSGTTTLICYKCTYFTGVTTYRVLQPTPPELLPSRGSSPFLCCFPGCCSRSSRPFDEAWESGCSWHAPHAPIEGVALCKQLVVVVRSSPPPSPSTSEPESFQGILCLMLSSSADKGSIFHVTSATTASAMARRSQPYS